ncbi:hypothetical protein Holit_01834 [Hollandina sp. SP2]
MHKSPVLAAALCSMGFRAGYKGAVGYGFSGQPPIALECVTAYGVLLPAIALGIDSLPQNIPGPIGVSSACR